MAINGTTAGQATNKRGEQMKNNTFIKTFFMTVLLMALVGLVSCNNNAELKKENAVQEGIVVTGSFTFDGMTAGDTSTGRSAAPSYSELNETAYYGVVLAYSCNEIIVGYTGGDPKQGGGEPIYEYQKDNSSISSGTVDFSTNKWKIALPESGHYCIEVQLFLKDENPEDDVPVLKGESAATEIVLDSAVISSHLNSTIAWPGDPISLMPNPGYANDHNSADNLRWANVPFCLGFRYPKGTDISTIYGLGFEYKKGQTVSWDPVEGTEVDDVDENYTLLTVTGNIKINRLYKNGNYYPYQPEPYSGSNTGLLSFLDSNRKVLYTCNESITAIPGFTTDTWNWDDENDPHYYKDSNGKTYFNITQEMLDTYKSVTTLSSSDNAYVLFDKEGNDSYSVFKTVSTDDGISNGMLLAENDHIIDYAIAPLSSNYSESTQQIYTLEYDSNNNMVLVRYPTYTGYKKGEVITSVSTIAEDENFVSMYADNYGFIYFLFSHNTGAPDYETLYTIKRVCVYQSTYAEADYGKVQKFEFKNGENPVTFKDVFAGENTISGYPDYKLAAYRYSANTTYILVTYVDDSKLYYAALKMSPIEYTISGDTIETITIDISNTSDYVITVLPTALSLITKDDSSNSSYFFEAAHVTDSVVINRGTNPYDAEFYVMICSRYFDDYYTTRFGRAFGGVVKYNNICGVNGSLALEQIGGADGPYIRGWYTQDEYNVEFPFTDYSDCYFYGPVRFVARKQDALIIADEEIWYDKDRNEKDKDRIVTLDLAGFATGNNQMSVTYVETKFNWSLQNTNDGPIFLDF